MNERVLIIDGDLVAYRHAAGGEGRKVKVTHTPSGRVKTFNTRTEFKDFLKKKDFPYDERDYSFVDIQEPTDFINVQKGIKNLVNNLKDFAWADRTEIYMGSPEMTFRHSLPLPIQYKGTRGDMLKPVHLLGAKDYLCQRFGAVYCGELEADDVVTIRCYEELAKGNYPILATIDKDAWQTQGVALINWTKDPWKLHEIPTVGHLYKDGPIVKGDGLMFLSYQTLAGDPVDVYCPYDLTPIKYGPTKAMNALKNCQTEKEILTVMMDEYRKLYPSNVVYTSWNGIEMMIDWKYLMQMYWKCSYMKRSWDDDSSVWTFMKERGITV